jgi:dolichol-phosphate mannosyltransferase
MNQSTKPSNLVEVRFSLVVPFYNEEGNLVALLDDARVALDALGAGYEVVAVNDCSRDRTRALLDTAAARWPELRVIHHAQNRGQAGALWTGFQAARGAWIITMDGDGQNVPADIASLIELTQAGADMAVGVRAARHDSWLRKKMSRVANRVRGRVLRDGVSDSGCALKVFRREILAELLPLKTLYSFIPAMAVAAGFRVAERAVQHRERRAGTSSYGLGNMAWRPAVDMIGLWWYRRRRLRLRGE